MIDAEGDQRRKLNVKRKIDDLEDDRQIFVQLVETMRAGGRGANLDEMADKIQSIANFDEAKSFLRRHMGGEPTRTHVSDVIEADQEKTGSKAWHYETQKTNSRQRTSMLPMRRLTDIPVVSVHASP